MSTSTFPAVSLGFTILLLLPSQLYLWGSPFFFCVPSCISGIHHSSSAFQAVSLGFTIHTPPPPPPPPPKKATEVVTFRLWGWCMLDALLFGIHPPRTWTSGSFLAMRWNACVHRQDLSLYSHLKESLGNGVRTHVNSLPEAQRRIKLTTLHHAGQRALHYPQSYSGPWPGVKVKVIQAGIKL